jgi:MFS family permease
MGFFVLLAWTPFALQAVGVSSAMQLGYIFFGWGVAVAVTSVFVAPMLTARFRRTSVLVTVIPLLAIVLLLAALFHSSVVALVVLVIVGGLFLGILNTVLTECSMEATDLPRPVASSAYSGVRFVGGAIAPPLASQLADHLGTTAAPFWYGVIVLVIATLIIVFGRGKLGRADGAEEHRVEVAEAIGAGDAD